MALIRLGKCTCMTFCSRRGTTDRSEFTSKTVHKYWGGLGQHAGFQGRVTDLRSVMRRLANGSAIICGSPHQTGWIRASVCCFVFESKTIDGKREPDLIERVTQLRAAREAAASRWSLIRLASPLLSDIWGYSSYIRSLFCTVGLFRENTKPADSY